jgi:hypothetical protein
MANNAINLANLTIEQLKNLIDNHRRLGMTAASLFADALSELNSARASN